MTMLYPAISILSTLTFFFFYKIITILLLKQSYIFVCNFVIPISLFVITILLLKQSYLSMQQSCYDNVVPGNLNILTFLSTLAMDIVVFRNVIVVVFVFVGEVLVQKKNKNVNVAKKKKKNLNLKRAKIQSELRMRVMLTL